MAWQHAPLDPRRLPAVRPARAGCGPEPGVPAAPRSTRGRWRALVLLGVHVAIALRVWYWLEHGETVSPLEPSEAALTLTEGVVNAGLVLFVLAIGSTLVLGRFFCGWACHVVALQDGCAWLLGRLGLRPKPVRSRALAFVPLFAALWIFVAPSVLQALEGALPRELSVQLVTDDFWARFPGPVMATLTFLAVGGLAVWLLGSKGFCTYGCPYGAVFGAVDRFARGRIRVTDACEGCGHCTAVCTSNVDVAREVAEHRAVVDPGCMKCLDCVSACPKDALFFGFAPRGASTEAPARGRARRPVRHFDFSGREELVLAAVFLATTLFAYRGLYGLVPFLLAVTLGVVAAVATVVAWRLVTRDELEVQHLVLARAGRLTRAGRVSALVLLVLGAFTAHAFASRYHDTAAQAELEALRGGEAAAAERARAHLEWVVRLGPWHAPALDRALGSLCLRLGDAAAAELALERAVRRLEVDGERRGARLELLDARLALAAQDPDAAERADRALAELLDAGVEGLSLEALGGRALALENAALGREGPTRALPVANLARLLHLVGDGTRRDERRAFLAERFPDDPATLALEAFVTGSR